MAKDLAIILNNGSLNSAVTTALAAQKYRPILLYCQMSGNASRAQAAFDQQVAHFKPYREHVLGMQFLNIVAGQSSAQNQAIDPRSGGMLGPQLLDLLPLVSLAARFAGHYQASAVYLGLRVGPSADELAAATEYVQILNELVQLPCAQPDLEIMTPLLELEPWQVVDVGYQVNAPLDKSWSCLEDGNEPCGTCRGCRIRESAFQQAGKPDAGRVSKRM